MFEEDDYYSSMLT